MQIMYCDKCKTEMKYDYFRVETSSKESFKNVSCTFRNFCPKCKAELLQLLDNFLPNFLNSNK